VPRDRLKVDDIPGARAIHWAREVARENDSLNVKDINDDGVFRLTRSVDPLNPVYFYDGQEIRADGVWKTRPPPAKHQGPDRMLSIADIEGAQADSSVKRYRSFRNHGTTEEEADILMIPSMRKQGEQLRVEQARRNLRAEKMREYEGRNLHVDIGGADEGPRKNARHDTF
jgi:hypothetical protein